LIGIKGARSKGLLDGLEHRLVNLTGHRIGPTGRSEAIDHQIHLTEIFLDRRNGLLFHLLREGVPVDAFGIETSLMGRLFKSNRIIPTSTGGFPIHRRTLVEHAQGRSPMTEGSGDASREPVARRGAQDEDLPRPTFLLRGLGDFDFFADLGFTSLRMRRHTQKTTNAGFNNHHQASGYAGTAS